MILELQTSIKSGFSVLYSWFGAPIISWPSFFVKMQSEIFNLALKTVFINELVVIIVLKLVL
jgi:hypothetical protein